MKVDVNVGTTIESIINIIVDIISETYNTLDSIYIAENVSILSVLVFLLIISAIIPIIMTIPQTSSMVIRNESRRREIKRNIESRKNK